jgi:hypothetical protein
MIGGCLGLTRLACVILGGYSELNGVYMFFFLNICEREAGRLLDFAAFFNTQQTKWVRFA